MKPSEPYKDALHDVVEEWCHRYLSPEDVSHLVEEGAKGELVQRILDLTGMELRLAIEAERKSLGRQRTPREPESG